MKRFTFRVVEFVIIAAVLFGVAALFGAPGVAAQTQAGKEVYVPVIFGAPGVVTEAVLAQEPVPHGEACLQAAAGRNLNCTANDVRIASFEVLEGPGTCEEGSNVTATLLARVVGTASERYDIGLYVGELGANAKTGGNSCFRDILDFPADTGVFDLEGGGDVCGDVVQGTDAFSEVTDFVLKCQDLNNDGLVDVSTCTSWDNTKQNVCLSELDAVANTPAKCNCSTVTVPIAIVKTGTIEVIKDLIPSTDPGRFNLQIDGATAGTGANVGDGGTTGQVTVSAGTNTNPGANHTVGETAGTGTDLNHYNSSLSCLEAGGSTTPDTDGTINVQPGDQWTCTITNTRKTGAILVTKTRKHKAGGSGDQPHPGVTFTVNGATGTTGANGQVCFGGLAFGTYNVVETVPSGYVADGAVSKPVTVDNEATCAGSPFAGETVSFSNTPLTNITVSVDSQVDGGTASTISCVNSSGGSVASGSTGANGDGSATTNNLVPGTYTCTVVVDP
jgi:hypothetical protein